MGREPARHDAVATDEALRLDKWLWFARVVKTRTLAATLISDGRVRVNRVRVTKPAHHVRPDDVVTISAARGVRVLRIKTCGTRRGPASEAQQLFEDLMPEPPPGTGLGGGHAGSGHAKPGHVGPGQGGPVTEAGSGRPTKKDRRVLDRLRADRDSEQ